jgi:RNA polymerase sigma-70 factor (ECF subfamily)
MGLTPGLANSPKRKPQGDVIPIDIVRRSASFVGGDAELVFALRRGDRQAMTELVRRYGTYVERILSRIMGPDTELPDLLHNVFIVALRRIETLIDPNLLKEWLRGIALLIARNTLRSRRRRRWLTFLAPDELPEVSRDAPEYETNDSVVRTYRALAQLPTDERILFTLRFIDGMEMKEVAEACGVSLSTAKRRMERAKQRFAAFGRRDPVLRELMAQSERWAQP